MSKCAKDNGSFGKGLEKLFRRWDGRKTIEESSQELPSLPPASPGLGMRAAGSLVWDREIRLLALLCLSVALLCLNWATMENRSDGWQTGKAMTAAGHYGSP